jgi:hypothetical protein
MRTPNCKCIICNEKKYRRPSELKLIKFVCCKKCRSYAYKMKPNQNSLFNLEKGREKGTNHLKGIAKSEEMKKKVFIKNKLFWKNNPLKLVKRGNKMKAEKHYNWKGGISKLQYSIRTCANNLNWKKKVLLRDNYICQFCGINKNLEIHHKIGVAEIITKYNIKFLDDARKCKPLWNINNGITICKKCHYKIHGRRYNED